MPRNISFRLPAIVAPPGLFVASKVTVPLSVTVPEPVVTPAVVAAAPPPSVNAAVVTLMPLVSSVPE